MHTEDQFIKKYHSLNEQEKFDFLKGFDQILDQALAHFFLLIATDTNNDDDIRIEAVTILGLYKGDYDDTDIKEKLMTIINADDTEDDSLIVNCINTLSLLTVDEQEIDWAVTLIQSDNYILFKSAAFALLAQHKNLPKAIEALKSLVNDKNYGTSAQRELAEIET
ncbi:HEAT repeat domain-containing protein [Paenibacillus sp. PsM32]|uniref:HEAT repeat domain-containing protein n=1 Tax=Paenibacillus sp. PsM32 TaxID=3030536 RepID=UPI00263A9CFB|nr:HEAT repeat domain-containing protein [Paenibacillus sp. PsM32]MDN4620583.1 HEAT repeat domain-containing protein [Paenibacillus sp. PsM32]